MAVIIGAVAAGADLAAAMVAVVALRKGCEKKSSKDIRSTGLRRNKPRRMETHSRDRCAATLEGILASLLSMFFNSCMGFMPENGGRPTSSSYRIVPTLHRSAAG